MGRGGEAGQEQLLANRTRLEVHGLFSALTSVPEQWIRTERRELFCVDYHGISVLDEPIAGRRYFLDPTSPEVVDLVAATSRHILESYPALEGIQRDFIRYYHYHTASPFWPRSWGTP